MFIWYIFGDRSLYIQHSAAYSCGPLQLMLFFYLSILGAQVYFILLSDIPSVLPCFAYVS